MRWAVYWDNGGNACGTFPQRFATEEEAQAFADDWMTEMNAIDPVDEGEEGYYAEPMEVKP